MPPKQAQLLRDASAALVRKKLQIRQEPAQYFSIATTAKQLGLTEKGLRGIVARREIESAKVGRLRRISADAIARYLARNTTPALD
jgi:excisionase family DNA binding protein